MIASSGRKVTVLPMDLTHGEISKDLGRHSDYATAADVFLLSLGLP